MKPQLKTETREIDKYQSLENLVKELQECIAEGYSEWDIFTEADYYNSERMVFEVTRQRPETPEEVNERLAIANLQKEARRRQFETLKKEFMSES